MRTRRVEFISVMVGTFAARIAAKAVAQSVCHSFVVTELIPSVGVIMEGARPKCVVDNGV